MVEKTAVKLRISLWTLRIRYIVYTGSWLRKNEITLHEAEIGARGRHDKAEARFRVGRVARVAWRHDLHHILFLLHSIDRPAAVVHVLISKTRSSSLHLS